MYNGLPEKLRLLLADYIFVYETKIAKYKKISDFRTDSDKAWAIFEESIRDSVVYNKAKNKKNKTLYYSRRKNLLLDFCRHLRNSFVHAQLKKSGDYLYISDKHSGKSTCEGYLKCDDVIKFIKAIVESYKNNAK